MTITLFYFPSNASLAPHLLLEELGIAYQLELVDRDNNAHKSAAYLALNPAGLIPVLVDGEVVLPESAAILMHLADQHAGKNFAPALNTTARAQYTRWMFYLSNTLQAEIITYYYPARMVEDVALADQVQRRAEARVSAMLDLIEAHMAQTDARWMVGESITAVDFLLFMLCRWTRNMRSPARTRPHLKRFLETMIARPAVLRAHEQEGLEAPYF